MCIRIFLLLTDLILRFYTHRQILLYISTAISPCIEAELTISQKSYNKKANEQKLHWDAKWEDSSSVSRDKVVTWNIVDSCTEQLK